MRQRMTNLERREKSLTTMVARAAGRGAARATALAKRPAPRHASALRPAGRRVLDKVTRNGRPPITKVESRKTG